MTPARATERHWTATVAALGEAVHELRARLGWSQQHLADRAATSQGAVSRLEAGRHPGLPLLTMVKIVVALADGAPPIAGAVSPSVRPLLALAEGLGPALDGPPAPPPDAALTALLGAYHRLPAARRGAFVRLVVPVAEELGADSGGERAA